MKLSKIYMLFIAMVSARAFGMEDQKQTNHKRKFAEMPQEAYELNVQDKEVDPKLLITRQQVLPSVPSYIATMKPITRQLLANMMPYTETTAIDGFPDKISPLGKNMAFIKGQAIKIWDIAKHVFTHSCDCEDVCKAAVTFFDNDNKVCMQTALGMLTVLDLNTGELQTIHVDQEAPTWMKQIFFSCNNQILTLHVNGEVVLKNLNDGVQSHVDEAIDENKRLIMLAVSSPEATSDSMIAFATEEKARMVQGDTIDIEFDCSGFGKLDALEFSPNGALLAISGQKKRENNQDNVLEVWDVPSNKRVFIVSDFELGAFYFLHDSEHIAIGFLDCIKIYNINKQKMLYEHQDLRIPRDIKFNKDTMSLIIWAMGVPLRVYDYSWFKELSNLDEEQKEILDYCAEQIKEHNNSIPALSSSQCAVLETLPETVKYYLKEKTKKYNGKVRKI